MKIIDRYICGKFLLNFFYVYSSLAIIYVLVDLTANVGDYFSSGSLSRTLLALPAYYFINSFALLDVTIPISIALAALITTVIMDHGKELIALLAMGISPARTMVPLVVGGIALSLLFSCVREFYLPNHMVAATRPFKDYVLVSDECPVRDRATDYKTEISFDGDAVNLKTNVLSKPSLSLPKALSRYGNRITAVDAVYLPTENDRPQGWLLRGATSPSELLKNESLRDESSQEILVYSPSDTEWLNENEVFVPTSLNPLRLAVGSSWSQYASIWDLSAAINDPAFRPEAVVLAMRAHSRALRLATDLLPMFLAVPFIFMKKDKIFWIAAAQGTFFASAYVAANYACVY